MARTRHVLDAGAARLHTHQRDDWLLMDTSHLKRSQSPPGRRVLCAHVLQLRSSVWSAAVNGFLPLHLASAAVPASPPTQYNSTRRRLPFQV